MSEGQLFPVPEAWAARAHMDRTAYDAAVARVEAELGPLTDLVPNAGIGTAKGLWDYTDKEWALLVGVNLTGTFTCLRAVLPGMVERRRGSVVNVASLTGVRRRGERGRTRRRRRGSSP